LTDRTTQTPSQPSRLRAKPWTLALACALTIATALTPKSARANDDVQQPDVVRGIENDAGNIKQDVTNIDETLKAAVLKERRFPLDKRFVDAQIAYERGNLGVSAVLLTDLVTNPEFQKSRDYGQGLYMLGDCMFRTRNYMGARRYLDAIARSPNSPYFQPALQQLADIAVRLHRLDDVEMYAKRLDGLPADKRKAELSYQFGRAFFSAKAYARAETFLLAVSPNDKRWAAAKFYLGAINVANKRLDAAIGNFVEVATAATATDEARRPEQTVLDYANVALGRLLLQAKRYEESTKYYRAVDRNSVLYEEALYESAAAHVAAARVKTDRVAAAIETRKALEALDILLLTVSDDSVAVQAAVLRGRINMIDKQYDQADAAYQDVVERFGAITQELNQFARDDKNLETFFNWLLNRASEEYTVQRPVSERVAKYIEKDEDMQRVVSLFDDMAAERADVKESDKLAKTIDAALREASRLDMFPELKDAWMRIAEDQNRTVDVGRRIVDMLRSLTYADMTDEEKARADALLEQRKKWQDAFTKVPTTKGDYVLRQTRVSNDFQRLSGDLSENRLLLEQLKLNAQGVAKMLNDRLYGDGGIVMSKDQENKIRADLNQVNDEVRRIFRELEELNSNFEIASQAFGAGDKVSSDENTIRLRLMAAQRFEQDAYVAALNRLGRQDNLIARLSSVRAEVDRLAGTMADLLNVVAGRANERISGMLVVLGQEKRNIAEYQVTVRTYEDDSRLMARQVGYGLIRASQNRLSEIVLEADLGRVDVAWMRKQEKADAIKSLQEERNGKLKTLGEVLDNLTTDDGGEQ
jgi:tetratricopeptide (TPR) repeat protein